MKSLTTIRKLTGEPISRFSNERISEETRRNFIDVIVCDEFGVWRGDLSIREGDDGIEYVLWGGRILAFIDEGLTPDYSELPIYAMRAAE